MKERPILFSGPMVRALLDGSKTQTRRIVKLPHNNRLGQWEPTVIGGENGGRTSAGETVQLQGGIWHTRTGDSLMCPHGQPGDRLWVREAWRSTTDLDAHSGSRIAELCLDAGYRSPWAPIHYEVDGGRRNWEHTSTPPHHGEPLPGRYRHARFMPRWASRTTLEVTGVRVERLQSISEADAIAEGIDKTPSGFWSTYGRRGVDGTYSPASSFHCLWESINGPDAWDVNPWVWVVEFKRISA